MTRPHLSHEPGHVSENVLQRYENRKPYILDEGEKQLTAQQRFEKVLGRLGNHRTSIINAIYSLEMMLADLDKDIALLESIRVKSKG